MKNKITYLNCILTVIAVALTVIVLQNAKIIQPAEAAFPGDAVEVNVTHVGGMPVFGELPVKITAEKQW